ncbi:LacI family DNA-binding transcriptional regulator [Paenarthrobacter sp. YIM B13468]|uniref:LacI family DNA-binding transcriptional regulator n=1 Tax=Paenarthrobacter sp. YIM B13468 TaxID=3366295 RepID=UPI00367112C1
MTRPTLSDVAKRAGMSTAAASLILNDRPSRLSAEAAERVRRAADELGYRPNLAARSLRTRSQSIGFVSDYITTSGVGGQLIHGAMLEARKTGHVVLIIETEHDSFIPQALGSSVMQHLEPIDESVAVNALLDRLSEGIIYAAIRSQPVVVPEAAKSVPVVLLNVTSSDDLACSVLPDEYSGGRSVAELLADNGFKDKIALIGSTEARITDASATATVTRRLKGIFSVMGEREMSFSAQVDCPVWDTPSGYAAVSGLLESKLPFDALLCLNDRLAFGAYQALAEAGLSVPKDVSVVSFDDDPLASHLRPQLTTCALPFEEMGQLAVRLLLDPEAEKREYLVEMPLRQRDSVCKKKS